MVTATFYYVLLRGAILNITDVFANSFLTHTHDYTALPLSRDHIHDHREMPEQNFRDRNYLQPIMKNDKSVNTEESYFVRPINRLVFIFSFFLMKTEMFEGDS